MQGNTENYCIGGGISGLIFHFYHPDFQIITPDIGGLYGKTYMVWLHNTPETQKLLKDLGYQNPSKYATKSWIGYYHKGWITERLSAELNVQVIQKKMTAWDQPIDKNFKPKTLDMSTTTQNTPNYMNTLDIDLFDLTRKLAEKAKYRTDKVTHVNSELIFTESGDMLPYKRLISTIPAPVFWKIWVQPKDLGFKYFPITNIITDTKLPFYDDRFSMIYYDEAFPFSRVSYMNGLYGIEFTGEITKEKFQELFPNINVKDYVRVPFGRIFENTENVPPKENIKFLGRFAQWKYGVTSEHVTKSAIEYEM